MKTLLTSILFVESIVAFADDCKKLSKEEIINYADIIFLGHVHYVNDSIYKVKVIEFYKGSPRDTLEGVITQSVVVPKVGSIWLIYGQRLGENRFLADACSGSKSLDSPFGPHDITFPEIPPSDLYSNPSQLFLLKQIVLDKSLNEFYFDVSSLRVRFAQKDTKSINQDYNDIKQICSHLSRDIYLMKWLLIILIFVSIFSIIITLRKK